MELERLREIAANIARVYPCRRISVFGSRARGDWHTASDLNLCIVARGGAQLPEDWLDRIREVKRRVDLADPADPAQAELRAVGLDPHVYTEAELKSLREREDPYTLQMLAEEKRLYEAV